MACLGASPEQQNEHIGITTPRLRKPLPLRRSRPQPPAPVWETGLDFGPSARPHSPRRFFRYRRVKQDLAYEWAGVGPCYERSNRCAAASAILGSSGRGSKRSPSPRRSMSIVNAARRPYGLSLAGMRCQGAFFVEVSRACLRSRPRSLPSETDYASPHGIASSV